LIDIIFGMYISSLDNLGRLSKLIIYIFTLFIYLSHFRWFYILLIFLKI